MAEQTPDEWDEKAWRIWLMAVSQPTDNIGAVVMLAFAAELRAQGTELDDWRESHQRVMAEDCPSDQKHCTCVPALRAEIANLHNKLGALNLCDPNALDKAYREIAQLKALSTCRCGDGFTVDDPGQCGNCSVAQRLEIAELKAGR